MKIMLVNKYFYPKGGDCLYTLRLMSLLQNNGHTVIPFGMAHPRNIKSEYDKYFVSYIDFNDELRRQNIISSFKVASRAVINLGAARAINRLIDDTKPDLIHLQNIHHQLTPSIVIAAARKNIPIVWTMHDYILACPNDNLLRDSKICTDCVSGHNYHMIRHRCKKGSLGASVLAAWERMIYNPCRLANVVSKFICPSRFMADILLQTGVPSDKITVLSNFLFPENVISTGRDYFLYTGRLTVEKGVDTLIDAFGKADRCKLVIAGEGPQGDYLKAKAVNSGYTNIDFIGYQPPENIKVLLAGCIASVVPSICYENFPYAVMEAMFAGKPVIASRIGGIPEMIDHQVNGLLFEQGNHEQLANMINIIRENKSLAIRLGLAAKEKAINDYSGEKHYEKLSYIYKQVLSERHDSNLTSPPAQNYNTSEHLIESMKG